jgi:hypothetical protein
MKTIKLSAMAALVLMLALASGTAWADGADKAAKAAPKHADALTDESLKEKLENLGYEPKVIKSKTGGIMYLLDFERGSYRYVFYCSLATDKSRLWLSSALRPLPTGKDLRADILEKILAKNDDIGPTHFTLRNNRYLYLELALENRGITSVRLRKEIDAFAAAIKDNEPLWNPARYPKLEAPGAEAAKK